MITVLGASGFIGSQLVSRLREAGASYWAPARGEALAGRRLGTVLYCVGLTADFRERPLATVEAHVGVLTDVLRQADVQRLVYLSSTRVYRRSGGPCGEDAPLRLDPADRDDLYGLSKALGESVALHHHDGVVVRLSNVYGAGASPSTFLAALIADALRTGEIVLGQTLDSEKDYVSIRDVVDLVLRIADRGRHRVYNVAGGANVTHGQVAEALRAATGCAVRVHAAAARTVFPPVSVARAAEEFGYRPARLLDDLAGLVAASRGLRRVGA